MATITIYNKRVICPMWKEEITLRGEYILLDKEGHTYEAKFLSATCPILENIRLPQSKKDEKYMPFPFCNVDNCELLNSFEPIIDVRKH